MRAILIDPYKREITEVDISGDFMEIYKFLSNDMVKVSTFTTGMTWDNRDILYVDDEGLFKNGSPFFDIGRADGQPLAGMGIIMGGNSAGESVSVKASLKEIQELVRWTGYETAGVVGL